MPHQPANPMDYAGIRLTKAKTAQRLAAVGYFLLLPAMVLAILALSVHTNQLLLATISIICLLFALILPLSAAHLLRRNNTKRREVLQTWAATQGFSLTQAQTRDLIIGQVNNQIYGSTLLEPADTLSSITLLHIDDTWRLVATVQVKELLNRGSEQSPPVSPQ